MVSARPVDPSTRDLLDRRLLNVVEEMAIASGVAVPRVFVMDDQNSINAFARAFDQRRRDHRDARHPHAADARRAAGVIGHEFSHVLNATCG